MGANAQTSVPLFVANSVLTAAQQNISAATGVPVFATTVTRDAAFGGSNKALAEGQLAYIEASNIVQYYDGASWATVGPSSSSGLVCVKAETAFSAAATITADGVFTSTYRNYTIFINTVASGNVDGFFKLRASGTSASTNYNIQTAQFADTSGTFSRSTAQTSARFSDFPTQTQTTQLNLFGPQVADRTNFIAECVSMNNGTASQPVLAFRAGNHSDATAYDGIEILPSSGTLTGTYTIYGYSKTV